VCTWRICTCTPGVCGVRGEFAGVRGEFAGVRGDVAGVRGDVVAIRGDVVAVRGDVAAVRGDVVAVREDLAAARRVLQLCEEAHGIEYVRAHAQDARATFKQCHYLDNELVGSAALTYSSATSRHHDSGPSLSIPFRAR